LDDDSVSGGAGDDLVEGNQGNDTVVGDEGNDTILGGDGDDLIVGGAGNDSLIGGNGADVFRFEYFGPEATAPDAAQAFGVDTLTDFTPIDDQIQLDATIFDQLTPQGGFNPFFGGSSPIAPDEFTTIANFDPNNPSAAGDANLVYDSVGGQVYYIDDRGRAINIMQLNSNLDIGSDDFEII
jgi:Ca2+-binding RTX toxin-like protein